ncbi:MAG: hypothetical protein ACLTC4_02235 [Hungatella hathewayi]
MELHHPSLAVAKSVQATTRCTAPGQTASPFGGVINADPLKVLGRKKIDAESVKPLAEIAATTSTAATTRKPC